MKAYWNGLPTTARQVTGVIPGHDPDKDPPLAWWRDLAGQRIDAVVVNVDGVDFGGGEMWLDDRDGSGTAKVTTGRGSPRYGHRNTPPLLDVRDRAGDPR